MASNSSSGPSIESFLATYSSYSPNNQEHDVNNLMASRSSVNVRYEANATPTFRHLQQMQPSFDSNASSQSTPFQNNRSYSQRPYQSSPLRSNAPIKKKNRRGFRRTLLNLDNITLISDGKLLLLNPSLSNIKIGSKLCVFTDRVNNLGRQFSFVFKNDDGCFFECERCFEINRLNKSVYKATCVVKSVGGKITVKESKKHHHSTCHPYELNIPNDHLETVPTAEVFKRPEAHPEVRVRQPIMPFASVEETENFDPQDRIGFADLGRLTSAVELGESMVANAKNSKLADIFFQTNDDKEVYSSKFLLYGQSEAFNDLLDSATPISKKIRINYPADVISKAIQFRCGKVSSVKGNEASLFKFANEFSLTKLKDECIKGIESTQLTAENVCALTIIAYQQEHEIFKLRCFNYLKAHRQNFGKEKLKQLLPIDIVADVLEYYCLAA